MSEGCNFGTKIALFSVLFTGLVHAEEPCDAEPRYLLVTVLAAQNWIRNKGSDQLEIVPNLSFNTPRPKLIDRCGAGTITFQNADHPSQYFPNEKLAKSEVRLSLINNGKTLAWGLMRIKESLSDLCRVMKDCGDATK